MLQPETVPDHVDLSWQELISKVKRSVEEMPAEIVDHGSDPKAAAAVSHLLSMPEMSVHVGHCDEYLGKHGHQIESLCHQVLNHGSFAHIVEFGAGKGLLGRILQELMPEAKLTLVEINDSAIGFDRADTQRIVLDVHDTARVREEFERLRCGGRVCAVAKHLCGSATDALLQALLPACVDCAFVAPCCHSKIAHANEYCNVTFLSELQFRAAEWPMLIKLLAVSRLPVDVGQGSSSEKSFTSWQRWEHTFGGRRNMIGLGRRVRHLIESGRAAFLKSGGFSNVCLLEYVPPTATSENILIVATRDACVPRAPLAVPKVGVLLHVPSGAVRTTQFLMEVRGALLASGGDLLWSYVFACSDDHVAVLGPDLMLVLSSLKEHASLLVGLRVLNCIYPFNESVPDLEGVLLPPSAGDGPFRLAVTPKSLLQASLAMAKDKRIELSPQHFTQTISISRLWDETLGVSCLCREIWHPGLEPHSWESSSAARCRDDMTSFCMMEHLSAAARRLTCRLEEWRIRLSIDLQGTKVAIIVADNVAWSAALVAIGAHLVEIAEAMVLVVDQGQYFKQAIASFESSSACVAIAVVPITLGKRGGKAVRTAHMQCGVEKATAGMRMSLHHFLSNRDQQRTIVLRKGT